MAAAIVPPRVCCRILGAAAPYMFLLFWINILFYHVASKNMYIPYTDSSEKTVTENRSGNNMQVTMWLFRTHM
jgi:hypothetical protein